MSQTPDQHQPRRSAPTAARMPRGVKVGLGAALGLVVIGAVWLAAVRGPAMLLDLSGMSSLFCL